MRNKERPCTGILKRHTIHRWKNWGLGIKLALVMSTLVVSAVALVCLGFIVREQRVAHREMEEQAKVILSSLAIASSDAIYFSDTNKLSDIARRLDKTPNLVDVRFYDREGRLIGSDDPIDVQKFEPDVWGLVLVNSDTHLFTWGEDRLVAGQAIIIGNSAEGAISVGISTSPLGARLDAIRDQGIGVASVAAVIVATLAVLISRSVTLPLRELVDATDRIAEGKFEFTSSRDQGDEVGVLSRSFAEMATRLFQIREGLEKRTEELSRTADELRSSTVSINYLDNIMASMADSLIVVAPDFAIQKANPAACKLLGYAEEELVGKPFAQILADDDFEDDLLYQVLVQGLTSKIEGAYVSKDGTVTPVEFSSSRMMSDSGDVEGTVCVAQDITQRRKDHQALINARQQALDASRAKSEFLASISHEIRTPMNAIIGMANALSTTTLTAEQRDYVQLFQNAGDSLLTLINDILDISKIESGKLDLEEATIDIASLVEDTVQIMAFEAHQKGLELCIDPSADTVTAVVGDPTRLRQIIINLLGNAMKFTHQGEVVLRVQNDPGDDCPGSLLFSVSDTGIGIPQNKIDHIFDTFTQADSSITREFGGTGLGLSICRRLVALMGGRIWVESELGKGSTFFFNVKLSTPKIPVPEPPENSRLIEGIRVLVVEPNSTNRTIIENLLATRGAKAQTCTDFASFSREVQQASAAGEPYHLVIMNRLLPDRDGFEAAKAFLSEYPNIKLFMMLTTEDQGAEVAKCNEAGCAGYIVKPVRTSSLLKAVLGVGGYTSPSHYAPTTAKSDAHKDLRPLKILLVEDYKNNRLVVQAYLSKTPYQIDIAENGEIAVEKSLSDVYDLILMDLQMPVMDGFTATQLIRERQSDMGLTPTPIIAISANAASDDIERCIAAGFDAHLTKPIEQTVLLETIKACTGGVFA